LDAWLDRERFRSLITFMIVVTDVVLIIPELGAKAQPCRQWW